MTNDLTTLLQRGLFEEEANRNLDAAITSYESLAKQFDKDRQIAATAVFRLGECYRKLGKTNEAALQYERILRDFSDQQTLVTLSRQNLSAIAPTTVSLQGAARSASEAYEYVVQAGDTLSSIVGAYRKNGVEVSSDSVLRMNPGLNPTRLRVGQKILVPAGAVNEMARGTVDTDVEGEARTLAAKLNGLERFKDNPEKHARAVLGLFPDEPLRRMLENLSGLQAQEAKLKADSKAELKSYRIAISGKLQELDLASTPKTPEWAAAETQKQLRLISEQVSEIISEQRLRLEVLQSVASSSSDITKPDASPVTDDEEKEIRRIQAMIQNSPDLINASVGEDGTPLFQAASKGQIRVAAFLLDHGADVDTPSGMQGKIMGTWTPLIVAANHGHKAMVELLLDHGARMNTRVYPVGSALNTAVRNNFQAVAEVLLNNKADVDATDQENNQEHTPLYWAVKNGKLPLVKLLLAKGANVNAKNTYSGETALHVAAEQGNQDMLRLLLDSKADVNAKTSDGATPLYWASSANNVEGIKMLLATGADVNVQDQSGETPLFRAVQNRRAEAIAALLQAKADPNRESKSSNTDGWTPLHLAAYADDADAIKLLASNRTDINARDRSENTPLFTAVLNGRSKAVVALLDAKADPNQTLTSRDRERWAPLHYAAEKGNAEIAEVLLKHGANPDAETGYSPRSKFSPQINQRDWTGAAPLHLATSNRKLEVVKLLLAHKANPNVLDKGNPPTPPLLYAIWSRDIQIVTVLLDNGADVNSRAGNQQTALQFAVDTKMRGLVEVLLAHKPDVNAMDASGWTALDRARGKPDMADIEALLRKHGAMDDLPKLDRIEVRRASAKYSRFVFGKSTNDWNRFTLFELIAAHYGFIAADPRPDQARLRFDPTSFTVVDSLAFPAWEKVVIRRPVSSGTGWKEIPVDLYATFNSKSGDCSQNIPLQWGDVVEIPEADHPIDTKWGGLFSEGRNLLQDCLKIQVQLTVKGQTTNIVIAPKAVSGGSITYGAGGMIDWKASQFCLAPVLRNSGLLRASSDLSRVVVTRVDPTTGRKRKWMLDCSGDKAPDLWLRDGDVIEVPEK